MGAFRFERAAGRLARLVDRFLLLFLCRPAEGATSRCFSGKIFQLGGSALAAATLDAAAAAAAACTGSGAIAHPHDGMMLARCLRQFLALSKLQ